MVEVAVHQLATAGVIGCQAEKAGVADAREKVRIERDDHIRLDPEAVLRIVVVAKGRLEAV